MKRSPYPLVRPTLCGHVDGFCLRDEVGAIIDTWPDFDGANAGYYTAMAAQVLLAEVFSRGRVS